jgi:hypothetical protein
MTHFADVVKTRPLDVIVSPYPLFDFFVAIAGNDFSAQVTEIRRSGREYFAFSHDCAPARLVAPILLDALSKGYALMNVEMVTERVRAEFEEMPGMMLTVPQASRLFGLDHDFCRFVADRLVRASYLRWTPDGALARSASADY